MLLTIDPSTNLGWSLGPASADALASEVAFGTIKLSATSDLGAFLQSADDPLAELFGQKGATRWAIEIPNTQRSYHSAILKGCALFGHCLYMARVYQMPPPSVFSPTELKLALTGNGAAKKGEKHPEMERAARLLGHMVQNDHEADAIALRRAYLFGVPETKTEREKREAGERRAARDATKAAEAKKAPKLL